MNSINHDPTFEKSYKPPVADAWDSDEWNYVPLVSLVATTKEESAESEIEISLPVVTVVADEERSETNDVAENKPAAASSTEAAQTPAGLERKGKLFLPSSSKKRLMPLKVAPQIVITRITSKCALYKIPIDCLRVGYFLKGKAVHTINAGVFVLCGDGRREVENVGFLKSATFAVGTCLTVQVSRVSRGQFDLVLVD
jgi:hypothetical protein